MRMNARLQLAALAGAVFIGTAESKSFAGLVDAIKKRVAIKGFDPKNAITYKAPPAPAPRR